jgi:hypothetical protein
MRLRKSIRLSIFLVLLTSACATTSTDWFGIEVPDKIWQVETMEADPHQLGAVKHRSIEDCHLVLMIDEPVFVTGNPDDWEVSRQEEETEALRIFLVTAKDADGQVASVFYDVMAKEGPEYDGQYRLAYYKIERGDDSTACMDAFRELLISIDPTTFPILEIPQG